MFSCLKCDPGCIGMRVYVVLCYTHGKCSTIELVTLSISFVYIFTNFAGKGHYVSKLVVHCINKSDQVGTLIIGISEQVDLVGMWYYCRHYYKFLWNAL